MIEEKVWHQKCYYDFFEEEIPNIVRRSTPALEKVFEDVERERENAFALSSASPVRAFIK